MAAFVIGGLVLGVVPFGFLLMFLAETRTKLTRTARRLAELEESVALLQLQQRSAPVVVRPAPAPAPSPIVEPAGPPPVDLPAAPTPPPFFAFAEETAAPLPEPEPLPAAPREPPPIAAAAAAAPAEDEPAPRSLLPELSPERVVVWIAAGLGGLAALLAALFGLATVVERGWLGPVARVSAAFVGGTALWVGGAFAGRRWPRAGSALAGAGIGTLYGASYAGSGLYHLFSPTVASVAMMAITVLGTLRAWRRDDRFVAWLSLIGGLLTPVLVSTGANHPYQLFAYLALLATGMVVASVKRGWPEVVLMAALGAAGLHGAWTSEWYASDQVAPALAGAVLLHLPFAAVAATRTGAVRWAAVLGALLFVAAALPWMVPVDPLFVDPRTGLQVMRAVGFTQPLVVVAELFLVLPLVLGARRLDTTLDALPALIPPLVLPLVADAWLSTPDTGRVWPALMSVSPMGVALLAATGRPTVARVLVGALVGVTIALVPFQLEVDQGWLALPLVVVVGASVVSWRQTGWGVVFAAGLVATAVLGWVSAGSLDPERLSFVVGPALLALAWFGQAAVRLETAHDREVAWLSAAAAPLVVFPVLYRWWTEVLGDAAIGVLPLVLGTSSLLSVLALLRRRRLSRDGFVVAVFTLVVLLGVTAAVPMQLRDRWLTVAWALEAAALARLGRDLVRHPLVRGASLVLSVAVAARLLLNPWALAWGEAGGWPILNWTLYSWGVPALAVGSVAATLPRDPQDPWAIARLPVGVLALLIGFGLVNVEVSHAFQPGGPLVLDLFGGNRAQSMVRSASWAGYGLAVLAAGLWRDQRAVRLIGFCFVLLATFKVFLVDLWDLGGFLRVGSLVALAFALIVAAFAFERLVLRRDRSAVPQPKPPVEET